MNIAVSILKKSLHHIFFRIKLKSMDDIWYIMGGNCFGLFPPSFYYTHTENPERRLRSTEAVPEVPCSG